MKVFIAFHSCSILGLLLLAAIQTDVASAVATANTKKKTTTAVNSNSIESIIHNERRFMLYNSRQLSGECLPICYDNETTTPSPSRSPVEQAVTGPPIQIVTDRPTTDAPTTASPTKNPTLSPTENLTKNPTSPPSKNPTASPTESPTKNPTSSPTASPSKNPTELPTKVPTNDPTKSPTAEPTSSPTKVACEETIVSDVCIAVDNSGSVCTSPGNNARLCDSCDSKCRAGGQLFGSDDNRDLCCGNYKSVTQFVESYIDRLPAESTFSVVKFGSSSSVIADAGSSPSQAKNAISSSKYTGGYTYTEGAIRDCVDQLQDSRNPVIVVITDGTPTVCDKKNGSSGQKQFTGKNGCNESKCSNCPGGSFAASAERAADVASEAGMSLIPVIVSTVSSSVDQLEGLARCPAIDDDQDNNCDVNAYKGLTVENLDELDNILDDLVQTTECAGSGGSNPTPSPTNAPKKQRWWWSF